MPPRPPRAARQIIDQAIQENRTAEYLLYALSALFVLVGLFVIVWGAVTGEGIVAVAGAISAALCLPAMRMVNQIRRENAAIRLLEAPLTTAATAQEAAAAIRDGFTEVFVKSPGKEAAPPPLPAPGSPPDAAAEGTD